MSTTNSGGLWTVFQFSFLPKLQAAVWHQETFMPGHKNGAQLPSCVAFNGLLPLSESVFSSL